MVLSHDVVYLKANEFLKLMRLRYIFGNSGAVAIIFVLQHGPVSHFHILFFMGLMIKLYFNILLPGQC